MIAVLVVALLVTVGVGVVRRSRPEGFSVAMLRRLAGVSSPGQRDWIEAMLAEHDALDDDRARRRFARGCLRAAVSAVRPADATARLTAAVVGLGATSAVGLGIYGLLHYPGLRAGRVWILYLAVFVVLVAGYALAGFVLGGLGSPAARRVGLLAGLPVAVGAWWAARSNTALAFGAIMAGVLVPAIAAVYVARRRRRADDAVVAAWCGCLAAGLVAFIAFVITTYATNGGPATPLLSREFARSGAHDYASWAVGDNLGGAVFLLLFIPVVGVALGALAARMAAPRGSGGTCA